VTGVVDNVAALVNPDTRAVSARVVVANPGGVLKKSMYVRVTCIRDRAPAACWRRCRRSCATTRTCRFVLCRPAEQRISRAGA